MLKFEVADMEDLQAMDCVNPHDILHSPDKSSQQLRMDFNIRVQQQQQDQASKVDVYSLHSDVIIPAGNRKIAHIKKAPQNGTHASQSSTIEMEQFQNLDTNFALYEANFDSSAVVNELNTPVFEKNNPFDLDVDSHSCPSPYQYSFNYVIKEEPVQNFGDYHSVSLTPAIISDNQSSYKDSVAIDHQYQSWQHCEESSSSLVIVNPSALNIDNNSNNNSTYSNNSISDASLLSPAAATSNEMLLGDFQQQQQSDDAAGNMFDKHGYFDVLVPSSVENVFDIKEEEPSRGGLLLDEDDSANCRLAVSPRLVIPPLGNLFGTGELVSTPDVITTIEAIEAEHEREFNILHCISEQDIVTSSDIISSLSIPTITKPQPFNFTNTTPSNHIKTSNYINPTAFPQKIPPTTSSTTSTPINISTFEEQITAQSHLSIKSNRFGKFPRRRPAYDDDDEDYIPPTSKRQRRTSTVKPPPPPLPVAAVTVKTQVEYDSDVTSVTTNNPSNYGDSSESSASDSDDDDDDTFVSAGRSDRSVKVTKKSRGRPPATTTTKVRKSTASSSSFVNKYREMRDKNNEASRKSRLKKKQKEHNYHSELDDMELRNVQLKAQVSELQSTVQTFRANLMNILLTKK